MADGRKGSPRTTKAPGNSATTSSNDAENETNADQEKRSDQEQTAAGASSSGNEGGSTVPNLYNKFVTSFENAIHELVTGSLNTGTYHSFF